MSNRAITATGLLLGAAIVGLPLGVYAACRYRCEPEKPYSQADTITGNLSRLIAHRKGATA
jgi:hypothetical protein